MYLYICIIIVIDNFITKVIEFRAYIVAYYFYDSFTYSILYGTLDSFLESSVISILYIVISRMH